MASRPNASARSDVTVKVDGLSRLRRTLREAGEDVGRLKESHTKAAQIVATAARVTVPRLSGRLMATVKGRGLATGAVVSAGTPKTVPYALPIHWGWPSRNIEAQPFASDAATKTEPVWLTAYMAELDDITDSVKGA